jgi:hypothetical protein
MAKSEYLQREEAAKKQLGAKGVKKRVKQLPTAARASLREMTGIDVSRKGVSVDPLGLAMAVSPFKLLKASKALRAAGKVSQSVALEARVGAKEAGRFFGGTGKKSQGLGLPMDRAVDVGGKARNYSESLFPRLPSKGGDAPSLLRGSRDIRTFDKYADLTNEGAGRFKGQNLLESMIQGSKTRSGMNRVKTASEVAKKLAKYKTPKGGR